jgi:hypothetical protein
MIGTQLELLLGVVVAEPEAKLSVLKVRLAETERDYQTARERTAREARLTKYKQVKRKAVEESTSRDESRL